MFSCECLGIFWAFLHLAGTKLIRNHNKQSNKDIIGCKASFDSGQ